MHGMKHYGLKGLFLVACLCLIASQALAQPAGPGKVLVLPFEVNASDALQAAQSGLTQLLTDKLRGQGIAVEGGKSAVKDVAAARKLAAAAHAQYVVFGSITKMGESLSLDARVAPAASGEPTPVFATAKSVMALEPAAASCFISSSVIRQSRLPAANTWSVRTP